MKAVEILYQTLEDQGNYHICEEEGPYPCNWENTWLGEGYYFWYHHIDLGKWWGGARYGEGNYVIFETVCHNTELCWDLHGDGSHQEQFMYWLQKLNDRALFKDSTTVAQVIEFIKNEAEEFNYEAIRILGVDSISKTKAKEYNLPRIPFEIASKKENQNHQKYKAYFDLLNPVQLCLFTKTALDRRGFSVVFPEEYREDYTMGVF